jgi:hypothetical protein|tara:strand:- start:937 stop:1179 length:243 start_codon:yes stop_codon:yes gene_type:complete
MEKVMFKLRNLVLIAAIVTLTGCGAFTEAVVAVPGTVVDTVGSVGSATWNLLTGWIPGVGVDEAVTVIETAPVVVTTPIE